MYLEYWGLTKFPFENVADPYFFYLSESHEEALSRLLYASKMRPFNQPASRACRVFAGNTSATRH